MESMMDVLQVAGGVILCAGYIPQIRRILSTRSAHDLSLTMWVSVFAGLSLMQAYAINVYLSAGTVALLVTNSASLLLSISMVGLILVYGARPAMISRLRRARLENGRPAPAVVEIHRAA